MKSIDLKSVVATISNLHETAQSKSKTAGNIVLTQANWKIGKQLNSLLPKEGERNVYGERVLEQLSEQLNEKYGRGFSRRSLSQMRQFHRVYEADDLHPKLTWTHYTFLLEIKNDQQRKALERRAIKEGLTSMALRSMVRTRKGRESDQTRPEGKLYTYRTVEKPNLHTGRNETYLDFGFGIYNREQLNDIENTKELSDFPAFQLKQARKQGTWKAEPTERSDQHLYLGYPERVVDGDTLLIKLDLGFSLLHRTRLRLSGVEAPEKGSEYELKIMRLMERKLKPCPVILVKTIGMERYGRWLARILYMEGTRSASRILKDGKFLNEELIGAVVPSKNPSEQLCFKPILKATIDPGSRSGAACSGTGI